MAELVDNILVSKQTLTDIGLTLDKPLMKAFFDTLHEAIEECGTQKPWIIDPERKESILFGQLEPYIRKLASVFQNQGLKSKDVVTVVSDNRVTYHITVLAAWLCGATVNLLDPWVEQHRVEEQLRVLPTKFIICIPEVLSKVKNALETADQAAVLFLLENCIQADGEKYFSVKNIVEEVNSDIKFMEPESPDPEDLAMILWSSGSTGKPKGIKLPYRVFIYMVAGKSKTISSSSSCVMGTWMFHYGGFSTPLSFLHKGLSLVYHQPDKITPEKVLRSIAEHKSPMAFMSYHDVVRLSNFENTTNIDVSSMDIISPVGAKLPDDCPGKLKKLFPNLQMCLNFYGATEMGGVFIAKDNFSGGVLYPGVKVKVCNIETGELCKENEEGELCVLGSRLMLGYLGIPNENTFDKDGFFKTGDIGYYDSKCLLYFTDRLKDLIKVGLHHVYPAEIETVLQEHPNVAAAGVFGIPDQESGEVCAALVTLTPEAKTTEEEIKHWFNDKIKLETWKKLKHVKFVTEFPLNSTGKKVRRNMKALLDSML